MHELALMEGVAELALAAAQQRGAEAITAIHLRIGLSLIHISEPTRPY